MLFLTLDTFDNTGGIQKVCRTLAYTLADIKKSTPLTVPSFFMFSLYDRKADMRYLSDAEFRGFGGRKFHFFLYALFSCVGNKTVIISHINLIPIALCIKILRRKTTIVMLAHGIEVWYYLNPLKRWFIRKHVKIWAVSNFTKHILEERHHINSENIEILNNALDPFFGVPDKFEKPEVLLRKHNLSKDQPILLTVTRLSKHETDKGYDHVIKLMPELIVEFPSLHYFICGKSEDSEKYRLQLQIEKENLQEHVSIVDFIPDEELTKYYLLADTFILPSIKEGFGLVFIEAAACGCKIISGNKDGSTDAMLGGRLGYMINPQNMGEMKKTLITSLKQSHNSDAAFSIQKKCLQYFGQQAYQQRTEKLLINIHHNNKHAK